MRDGFLARVEAFKMGLSDREAYEKEFGHYPIRETAHKLAEENVVAMLHEFNDKYPEYSFASCRRDYNRAFFEE